MSEKSSATNTSQGKTKRRIAKRVDTTAWGLIFIWIGTSLLMDFSWGVGLVGVSAIVLLGQVVRRSFGLRLEPFWLLVGMFFLLGGVWELRGLEIDLLPIILIAVGGWLMVSLFRRDRRNGWREWCRGMGSRDDDGWRCCSWSSADGEASGSSR